MTMPQREYRRHLRYKEISRKDIQSRAMMETGIDVEGLCNSLPRKAYLLTDLTLQGLILCDIMVTIALRPGAQTQYQVTLNVSKAFHTK